MGSSQIENELAKFGQATKHFPSLACFLLLLLRNYFVNEQKNERERREEKTSANWRLIDAYCVTTATTKPIPEQQQQVQHRKLDGPSVHKLILSFQSRDLALT